MPKISKFPFQQLRLISSFNLVASKRCFNLEHFRDVELFLTFEVFLNTIKPEDSCTQSFLKGSQDSKEVLSIV